MTKMSLYFGAACSPVSKQLCEQGVVLPEVERKRLDAAVNAMNTLNAQGYLTCAEREKVNQRILKGIKKAVEVTR